MAMVLAMAIVTLSAMVMLLGMLVVMIMIVMVVIVVAMDDNAGNDAMVMMAMVGLLKISMLFNQHHVYNYRDHHHHRRYHHRCGHHHHRDSQQHARLDLCRAAESFSLNQIFGSLIVHLSYSSPSQTSRSLSLTSRLRRSTAPLPA